MRRDIEAARDEPLFDTGSITSEQAEEWVRVLQLFELLVKPTRLHDADSLVRLKRLLARLTLYDATAQITDLAAELGAKYRLKTVESVHLATAAYIGADRLITNNRRDFPQDIVEVDITYPNELPAA